MNIIDSNIVIKCYPDCEIFGRVKVIGTRVIGVVTFGANFKIESNVGSGRYLCFGEEENVRF